MKRSGKKKSGGKGKLLALIIIILIVVVIGALLIISKLIDGYDIYPVPFVQESDSDSDEIIHSPTYEDEEKEVNEPTGYFINDNGVEVPEYENVDENKYDPALFYSENGRTYYKSDEARYGIDISSHQEDVDWEQVAASGVDFAMLRAAYRGYGAGTLGEDDYFKKNAAEATAAGIAIGAYVFSQATSEAEAIEEAEYVLELVKDYDVDYPIAFDWEPITYDTARTDNVTSKELTEFAIAFCKRIKKAGYNAAIYLNTSQGYTKYNLDSISEYEIWLADYDDIPDYYYHFNIWQYTNQGQIDGVNGSVDYNISFKNYAG